jgi:hypothetical protein
VLGLAELKLRAFLDLVSINSPSGDLKHIDCIGAVRTILWTRVVAFRADGDVSFDMCDSFLLIQPNEIECNLGVFHPEGPGLGFAEKKQHAVILLEGFPVHETIRSFSRGVGNFGLDSDARRCADCDQLRIRRRMDRHMAEEYSNKDHREKYIQR